MSGLRVPYHDKIQGATMTETPQKAVDEKICSECGSIINAKAEICPKCGVRQSAPPFVTALAQ